MKAEVRLQAEPTILPQDIRYGLFLVQSLHTEGGKTDVAFVTPHGVVYFDNMGKVTYSDRAHLSNHYSIVRSLRRNEVVQIYGGDPQYNFHISTNAAF